MSRQLDHSEVPFTYGPLYVVEADSYRRFLSVSHGSYHHLCHIPTAQWLSSSSRPVSRRTHTTIVHTRVGTTLDCLSHSVVYPAGSSRDWRTGLQTPPPPHFCWRHRSARSRRWVAELTFTAGMFAETQFALNKTHRKLMKFCFLKAQIVFSSIFKFY